MIPDGDKSSGPTSEALTLCRNWLKQLPEIKIDNSTLWAAVNDAIGVVEREGKTDYEGQNWQQLLLLREMLKLLILDAKYNVWPIAKKELLACGQEHQQEVFPPIREQLVPNYNNRDNFFDPRKWDVSKMKGHDSDYVILALIVKAMRWQESGFASAGVSSVNAAKRTTGFRGMKWEFERGRDGGLTP